MKKTGLFSVLAFLTAAYAFPASSALVITGTRVVYPANEKEVTVKFNNNGTVPVLAQSWIDSGNENDTPETAKAPFTLTPPITRVNPGKGQTLRLRYSGETLPQNKESVFWLNVLEIPPKVEKEKNNMLQMAFRSRLKIFFRPQGLEGTANSAPKKVVWHRNGNSVTGNNPTPYHVSIAFFSADDKGENTIGEGGMIAPGETKTFNLDKNSGSWYPVAINDYGALTPLNLAEK